MPLGRVLQERISGGRSGTEVQVSLLLPEVISYLGVVLSEKGA